MRQTFSGAVAALALWAGPVSAQQTTTAEVGNAGGYLAQDATCQEVIDAFAAYEAPTYEQTLLLLNLATFHYGYAFAKGITIEEAFQETAARCTADPSQPFAGLPVTP